LLWDTSSLDSAFTEDGRKSVPCKEVVAHKHAVTLVECFFVGDYPGSKAMVSTDASWLSILLQSIVFFLPDLICPVSSPTWPNRSTSMQKTYKRVARAGSEEEEPENWAIRSQHAEIRQSGADDMFEDVTSFRFLHFFNIPKVKFLLHQIVFLVYIFLPVFFLIKYETDKGGINSFDHGYGLPHDVSDWEYGFWVWTVGYLVGEFEQAYAMIPPPTITEKSGSASGAMARVHEGFRMHFRVGWNAISLSASILSLIGAALRLLLTDEYTSQIATRCCYAGTVVLSGFKLLQVIRISENVGVLSIITMSMIINDCPSFVLLVVVFAPPFGFALVMLQPRSIFGEQNLVGGWIGADLDPPFSDGIPNPVYLTVFRYFDSPFWAPWLALLGDFDIASLIAHSKGVQIIEWLLPLLYYVYLVLALIVLLNLLIAVMSSTYEKVNSNANIEWKYSRVALLLQYKDQKSLPPPFNIVSFMVKLLMMLARGCRPPEGDPGGGFKVRLSKVEEDIVKGKEQEALASSYRQQVATRKKEEEATGVHELVAAFSAKTTAQMEVMYGRLVQLSNAVESGGAGAAPGSPPPGRLQRKATLKNMNSSPQSVRPPDPPAPPPAPAAAPPKDAYYYACHSVAAASAPPAVGQASVLQRKGTGFVPYGRAPSKQTLPPLDQ